MRWHINLVLKDERVLFAKWGERDKQLDQNFLQGLTTKFWAEVMSGVKSKVGSRLEEIFTHYTRQFKQRA